MLLCNQKCNKQCFKIKHMNVLEYIPSPVADTPDQAQVLLDINLVELDQASDYPLHSLYSLDLAILRLTIPGKHDQISRATKQNMVKLVQDQSLFEKIKLNVEKFGYRKEGAEIE